MFNENNEIACGKIDKENLFSLISVNEPYFALEDIIVGTNNTIKAKIPIEQNLDFEMPPISCAEAGRHSAILGLCICALSNNIRKKHYYLAYEAFAERKSFDIPYDQYLVGVSNCLGISKYEAVAKTELRFPDDSLYCIIRIAYRVLPELVFERIYKKYLDKDENFWRQNLYDRSRQARNISITHNSIRVLYEDIFPFYCIGHFPKFPAIPVSVEIELITKHAIQLLQNIYSSKYMEFCVIQCNLTVYNLIFTSKSFEIRADITQKIGEKFILIGKVESNNKLCCEVELHLIASNHVLKSGKKFFTN